jgi:hypothetical protein
MNNDLLFFGISIFVLLVFAIVVFFWIRSSDSTSKGNTSSTTKVNPNGTVEKTSGLYVEGIYSNAGLNQRCTPNAKQNQQVLLLPGFQEPAACKDGYDCVKTDSKNLYGVCKAKVNTLCGTVFDCVPFSGTDRVYCNNICTTKPYGNVLASCLDEEPFNCDATKGLMCNNVTGSGETAANLDLCYNVLNEPCDSNDDCFGGICFRDESIPGSNAICRCHGNNVQDIKICMYVDGKECQYNQECYGGLCYKQGDNKKGICISKFLPGKTCEVIAGVDNCLNGFGCDVSSLTKPNVCQPIVKPDNTTTISRPARYGEQGALCVSYNYNGIPDPDLICNDGLVCNYDFTTSGPLSYPRDKYLQGFGICSPPTAKLGQPCSVGAGCLEPGICIQDNNGIGYCNRPQYYDDPSTTTDDPLILFVNNDTIYNFIGNGQSLINAYPQINRYNTLFVQLVGGGGGGMFGTQGPTLEAGNYGAGGGGSGEMIGYIGENQTITTGQPYFSYTNTNGSSLYPNSYGIDLTSFSWNNIALFIGNGGTGSTLGKGGDTTLLFSLNSVNVKTVTAKGGTNGYGPFNNINGYGGPGYNGGGAGGGGNATTGIGLGGDGNVSIGGQNGYDTDPSLFDVNTGNGGGLGAGKGGTADAKVVGSSDGGGGGAGSGVLYYNSSNVLTQTGGNGATALSSGVTNAISGMNYTGAGGGGGAVSINNSGQTLIAFAGNGGRGYAILKFVNIRKDINYAGNQEKIGTLPANGSSGKCALGFTSNGKNKISVAAKEFCIPNTSYTCNTTSINGDGFGTYCMKQTPQGAVAVTNTCTVYKIGIFVQVPFVSGEPNDYLGAWHFAELPSGIIPNQNSKLSVFQSMDSTNIYFNKVEIIFNVTNGTSTTFWYTSFSTKLIAPLTQGGDELLNVSPTWKNITVKSSSSSNLFNYIQDIKFTPKGDIGIIVNENTDINFPFTPGNPTASSTENLSYNRVYIVNKSNLNLTLNTLTYTASSKGPMFMNPNSTPSTTPGDPDSIPDKTSFDNMIINKTKLFVWDIDDLYNQGFVMAFNVITNVTKPYFFVVNITNLVDKDTMSLFNSGMGSLPNNVFYTTNTLVGANLENLTWDEYGANKNTVNTNYPNLSQTRQIFLQENSRQLSLGMNFNRLQDMEFYDFYYIVQGNQYIYVTVIYDQINKKLISTESQIAGYIPDLIYKNTSNQPTYKFTAIGNLDRSMYTIVQTCA